MMAASSFAVGWLEVLFILLGGSGLLGMPPGERDALLLKAAPQQTLMYFEWAGRAVGQPGAKGIDGLAADPEVRAFFEALDRAIANAQYPDSDDEQQRLQKEVPTLVKLLTAHPGCLFVGFEPPLPGESLLKTLSPNDVTARFRIGLVSSAGKDVEPLLETIARLAEVDVGKQPKLQEVSAGPMALKLTIHREADRVMIGFGGGTVANALACLKGEAPGLDTNERFQAGWKRVASPRVATVGWLDLRGVFENVTRTAGPAGLVFQAILQGASADALDYVVSGSGVVDGDIVQRTFLATGGRTDGLLLLAGGPALRNEQLRHIPADSDLVAAGSLNLSQVVRGARELVGRTAPLSASVFDEAVKQMESELGLNLERDVYPAIGDAWTAFDSPSEGGLIGSSLIVAVEVRDAKRAEVVFEHLMKLLAQSLVADADPEFAGKTAELKRQAFQGHTICYVNTVGWGLGSEASTTPSFCLTRGHILFALHPLALKAHLRQQSANRPGFDATGLKKLARPEGDLLALGSLDGARSMQALCALAPYFGQSVLSHLQSEGFPLDAFAIPSAAALLPYVGDATFVVVRQKDGLFVETKNAHTAILTAAVLGSAKSWFMPNYNEYLEARRQRGRSVQNAGLGAPEGQVVPAAAEKPAKAQEKPAAAAARVLAPLVIKALVPDGAQQFIPNEVFQNLGQPLTPEALQQREERRKQSEERRKQRQQKRPAPLPLPPAPQ